ncbi:MAG: glycosyltransferase family 4 protein [Bacteroidetes bacterium]|nr:glycosyltransferase family 4 protein [Bacteroidota bacterium]
MTVVYYTSTSYLDVIVETIQSIKNSVNLHVVIEIAPSSKNSTIINVNELESKEMIETPENLLGKEKWEELKPYFKDVASVEFVVQKNKRAFSFETIKTAYKLGKYLKKYKADILHFDSISTCAIGLYFYARSKKVFIAIHDPVPHSGEASWREKIPKKLFFPLAKGFFFYSEFALKQFEKYYTRVKTALYGIKLQPYTFVQTYIGERSAKPGYVLFFGRLSYYKGIDILLNAIPIIVKELPNQHFIIAGKPDYDFKLDETLLQKVKSNVTFIERFLSTEELVKLIDNAQMVVCPYRDATQSGVVMTTFAVGKPVVATNVGSFAEYISDGVNGLLAEPDSPSIAQKILEALKNDFYADLQKNVEPNFSKQTGDYNASIIINAYNN